MNGEAVISQSLPSPATPYVAVGGQLRTQSPPSPFTPDYLQRPSQRPPMEDAPCFECSMRDKDMADVDVTSPGVWDRESDVWYNELVLLDDEDDRHGIPPSISRPRSKGHLLTEHNLKLWLSMNPRESTARDSGVRSYVQMQTRLLEAESRARTKAAQESQLLNDQVRHTYSALRRSAYELSASSPLVGEDGVPVRVPRSASGSGFPQLSGLDESATDTLKPATLLNNGLIVEKMDLKEEEKARRKRERSRQRTTSRTSGKESVRTLPNASSMRSMDSLARPMSLAASSSTPPARPTLPSLRSLSHSSETSAALEAGSKSPRFFNFRNFSGMTSRSSLALSGSMIDMHLGLDQDRYRQYPVPSLPSGLLHSGAIDLSSNAPSMHDGDSWAPSESLSRRSTVYPTNVTERPQSPRKKKSRISKLLNIFSSTKAPLPELVVKSSSNLNTRSVPQVYSESTDPLAPPPPLSYLVDRGRISSLSHSNRNGPSSASLSSNSPRNGYGLSPLTTGSSALSSPTSARFRDSVSDERDRMQIYGMENDFHPNYAALHRPALHRVVSEPDVKVPIKSRIRHPPPPLPSTLNASTSRPPSIKSFSSARPFSTYTVDKDLPPLPPNAEDQEVIHQSVPDLSQLLQAAPTNAMQPFPRQTTPIDFSAYNSNPLLSPPRFNLELRRQSFSGMSSQSLAVMPLTSQPTGLTNGQFNDFGAPRRSLNRLDNPRYLCETQTQDKKEAVAFDKPTSQPTISKRRSRFGLSSLLGRKSQDKEKPLRRPHTSHAEDVSFIAQPLELPRHTRPSTGSRHGQFVDQERNFIAYRYPSAQEQWIS